MSTPSLPIKVLRASDPATLKLIHEYLDQNKGKLPDGKPITKLRRYVRKPNKPEKLGANLYTFNNKNGKPTEIALDESVMIFNAENPEKRRLTILKNKIGQGGFGRVKNVEREVEFDVINLQTGQKRVLKIASYAKPSQSDKSKPSSSPPSKETVMARAELEKELGGSEGYMVRELENGGKIYVDLPKHPGKTLFDHYKKKTIKNLDEKILIAIKMLEELKDRFHDKNYLHRDLKSENILYDTKTKKLRIIDMDLVVKAIGVQSLEEKKQSKSGRLLYVDKSIVGTRGYLAPEITTNMNYTEKTDVYALGVILGAYLGLSAQVTFKTENRQVTDIIPITLKEHHALPAVARERIQLGTQGCIKLRDLVLAMVNKDPLQRIGGEAALKTLYEIRKIREERRSKSTAHDKEKIRPAITPQMKSATKPSHPVQTETSSDKENKTPPSITKPTDPRKF